MEVKADRKGRYWEDIEGCGPTAAEIETLRKGVRLNATPDERRAACDLVDRLSPPAPEVDEATRIWREMEARSYESVGNITTAAHYRSGKFDGSTGGVCISYLRTALSELIASKDAEVEQAIESMFDWSKIAKKAESELAALRAENERLVKERDYLLECNGRSFVRAERLEDMMEAAERNTAEPAKTYVWPATYDDACSEIKGTDTTPEVVVTQGDREAAEMWNGVDPDSYEGDFVSDLATHFAERRAIELENVRTEAEARGRRAALDEALKQFDTPTDAATYARAKILRMMTGGK